MFLALLLAKKKMWHYFLGNPYTYGGGVMIIFTDNGVHDQKSVETTVVNNVCQNHDFCH
jgi:hypothetical protein